MLMKRPAPKQISPESIDRVLRFLPIFEQKGYKFSELCCPEPHDNGTLVLPFYEYSRDVNDFISTLYREGFIIPFNWPIWEYGRKLYDKPQLLKRAKLETLQKLLTGHIRQDRFCEGHLACVLENGHISAILHRLEEIRMNMKN